MNKSKPYKGYSLSFSQPRIEQECIIYLGFFQQNSEAYGMFVDNVIVQILYKLMVSTREKLWNNTQTLSGTSTSNNSNMGHLALLKVISRCNCNADLNAHVKIKLNCVEISKN